MRSLFIFASIALHMLQIITAKDNCMMIGEGQEGHEFAAYDAGETSPGECKTACLELKTCVASTYDESKVCHLHSEIDEAKIYRTNATVRFFKKECFMCPNFSKLVKGECVCDEGYKKVDKKCKALSCPQFATRVDDTCVCNKGYVDVEGKCKPECQEHSKRVSGVCKCNTGYKLSDDKTKCILTHCPAHATLEGQKCVCVTGFVMTSNDTCVRKCPKNSELKDDKCVCQENYAMVDGVCKQQKCPKKAALNEAGVCECIDGYVMENKACRAVECPPQHVFKTRKGKCVCKVVTLPNGKCGEVCPPNSVKKDGVCECKDFVLPDGKCGTACPLLSALDEGGKKCKCKYETMLDGSCGTGCQDHARRQNEKCVCTEGYVLKKNKCVSQSEGGKNNTTTQSPGSATKGMAGSGNGGEAGSGNGGEDGHLNVNVNTDTTAQPQGGKGGKGGKDGDLADGGWIIPLFIVLLIVALLLLIIAIFCIGMLENTEKIRRSYPEYYPTPKPTQTWGEYLQYPYAPRKNGE